MKINGTGILHPSLLLPANPAEQLVSPEQWKQVSDAVGLTGREQQVAKFLFQGETRRAIATQLGIRLSTVRHHLEQIHNKLQVTNRVGVALRIISIRDQLSSQENHI